VFRRYFLVNLILIIIIGFLGFRFYKVLARPLDIPAPTTKEQAQLDKKNLPGRKRADLDTSVYQVIVQKDLFRPSRSEPKGEEIPAEPPLKEIPKLFGTIITDKEKSAILEDPFTKVTRVYRLNDSISGFIISDIQKDKVVISKEDSSIEVKLREIKTIVLPPQQQPWARPQMPQGDLQKQPTPGQRRPIRRQPTPPTPPSEGFTHPDDAKSEGADEGISESGEKEAEQ